MTFPGIYFRILSVIFDLQPKFRRFGQNTVAVAEQNIVRVPGRGDYCAIFGWKCELMSW